jgi:hypothetical protein
MNKEARRLAMLPKWDYQASVYLCCLQSYELTFSPRGAFGVNPGMEQSTVQNVREMGNDNILG